jgi:isocitrate dehydrogenase (NAD+)
MAIRRNGVALKGGIESHACDPADYSRNVALRRNLDLYANVIEYKSYPGVESKYKDIDLVIVRQNSEGEYLMLEHEPKPGVIQNMKVVTAFNSERTAR